MRRYKQAVSDGGQMAMHQRDRRKAYYHGKYDREISGVLLLIFIALCVLSLQG